MRCSLRPGRMGQVASAQMLLPPAIASARTVWPADFGQYVTLFDSQSKLLSLVLIKTVLVYARMTLSFDCIVVGSGHAGSTAALSAAESGCRKVLLIDKCPPEWAGGNGYFTAGAHRTVHAGLHDLLPLVKNVGPEDVTNIDMEPYTKEQFRNDIMRLGSGRSSPELVEAVVNESRDTIEWLAKRVDIPFTFSFNRQAYEVNGRKVFWGGMVLSVRDGGKGLIAAHHAALARAGVEVWYNTCATELVMHNDAVQGLIIRKGQESLRLQSPAVVLAMGGFEASPEMRAKHLGPEWKGAMVRGTPYNTGDGFNLVSDVGAKLIGDWSGCHSTAWDANASPYQGDRELSNQFTKSGYPLGIMVNRLGVRFVDEGEDFRNYTYARFGRAILQQPGGYAFQIWDAKTVGWLREEEYGDGIVKKITADTLEELAQKISSQGLEDTRALLTTISQLNQAAQNFKAEHADTKWDPSIKDGLSTGSALQLTKSNWALPIDTPPYLAVKVACGITFTFGGVAINSQNAQIMHKDTNKSIHGLFACGEMVGGLFFSNYPGGSGLTAGAVFGRKAGQEAAKIKEDHANK